MTCPRSAALDRSADALFADMHAKIVVRTDRMMLAIFHLQWVIGIVLSLVITPYTWSGAVAAVHPHVKAALLLGGALNVLPTVLVFTRPGAPATRHVIAAVQMLWSALLIHLTGGRIETHFHVFGSLAFLAFYRDWRVLPTATVVVVVDHLVRGLLVPESVYGTVNPEWWRFLEHAGWVAFEDVVLVLGCLQSVTDMRRLARREAEMSHLNREVELKISQRTSELEAERARYQALVENTNVVPWEYDSELRQMLYVGPQIAMLGYPLEAWLAPEFWLQRVHPDDRMKYSAQLARAIVVEEDCALEYRLVAKDGRDVHVRDVVSVREIGGRRIVRGMVMDISGRKRLEAELAQAQKLEAVGHLAAGIAHEINTPVQFVNDSVQFVRETFTNLGALVGRYRLLRAAAELEPVLAQAANALGEEEERIDLDYTLENVPKALDLMNEGLRRVSDIVRSMKTFAHPDGEEFDSDLNEGLLSTLTIARNEYKYVADVTTDLGQLPLVTCRGGELNQVFLNILINAAHAIGGAVEGTDRKGKIIVRSYREGDQVVVSIADDGPGIPAAIQHKVFDQFFTTKPVGKGTGQGLSIARAVVARHKGTLTFTTAEGQGTTFYVKLPIRRQAAAKAA